MGVDEAGQQEGVAVVDDLDRGAVALRPIDVAATPSDDAAVIDQERAVGDLDQGAGGLLYRRPAGQVEDVSAV